MKSFYLKNFIFLNLLILCGYFVYLSYLLQHRDLGYSPGTLERIQNSGVLRLITTQSLNNFYLYRGEPTGFEYELAREFARYLHVDLDVVTPGWNNLLVYLDQGKGDFVGASMTINRERLEKVKFSIPYMDGSAEGDSSPPWFLALKTSKTWLCGPFMSDATLPIIIG